MDLGPRARVSTGTCRGGRGGLHGKEAAEEEHHTDRRDVDVLLAHPSIRDHREGKEGHEKQCALQTHLDQRRHKEHVRSERTHLCVARPAVTCFELPEDVIRVPAAEHAAYERACEGRNDRRAVAWGAGHAPTPNASSTRPICSALYPYLFASVREHVYDIQ